MFLYYLCLITIITIQSTKATCYPFYARHGISSMDYQSIFNSYTSLGYRLKIADAYDTGIGNAKFVAVFEKNAGIGSYVARHGLTSSQYQSFFNTYVNQGYCPKFVNGYNENGVAKFITLFEKNNCLPFVAKHDMSANDYQTAFNQYTSNGYTLEYASGYISNNQIKFVAFWVKKSNNSPNYVTHHNMDSNNYQSKFNQYSSLGYSLTWVNGYTYNGNDYYIAKWERKPNTYIAFHGLTSTSYQQQFDKYTKAPYYYTIKHVSGYGSRIDKYAVIFEKCN